MRRNGLSSPLRVLNPAFDPERFAETIRRAPDRVLLLDFDGTLSPFVVDRLKARPYPGVREALARIASDGRTRLALVSGRFVRELAPLVQLPIEMWGSHGLERLSAAGAYSTQQVPPELRRWLSRAARWIDQQGWRAVLERKPFGFSLHDRGDPEMFRAARAGFLGRFGTESAEAGLAICDFDGGVEVRPARGGKGEVVSRILAETPADTPVAYLGDDYADEEAFRALAGRGMAALTRAEPRSTCADVFLRTPEELVPFLNWWSGEGAGEA